MAFCKEFRVQLHEPIELDRAQNLASRVQRALGVVSEVELIRENGDALVELCYVCEDPMVGAVVTDGCGRRHPTGACTGEKH